MRFRNIFFESILIVCISAGSGFFYNSLSDKGIPILYQAPVFEQGQLITLSEALQLYNNKALFIDARVDFDYEEGHIQGAISIPDSSPFESKNELISKLAKDQTIVIYCGNIECGLSKNLADLLTQFGFNKVLVFAGGWEKWQNAGYPIE